MYKGFSKGIQRCLSLSLFPHKQGINGFAFAYGSLQACFTKKQGLLTYASLSVARFKIIDFVKGQRGYDLVLAFDLKGVSVDCSIMNGTFVKLSWPPK